MIIVRLVGQHTAHIHDGEVPFLLVGIPYGSYFLTVEYLYFMVLVAHNLYAELAVALIFYLSCLR